MAARRTRRRDPWGEGRLGAALAAALGAPGVRGRVDARRAAEALGVSPSTVRRWVRDGLPVKRREQLESMMLPAPAALAQERRELDYALEALRDIYGDSGAPLNPAWQEQGWLEPHVLAIVELERVHVFVARIGSVDGDQRTRARLRAGGVVVDQDIFPNRFAAQVAKGMLLEQVAAWRLLIPEGSVSRGRTEAWMAGARHNRVAWFVDHAPVKAPSRGRRRPSFTSAR